MWALGRNRKHGNEEQTGKGKKGRKINGEGAARGGGRCGEMDNDGKTKESEKETEKKGRENKNKEQRNSSEEGV